MMWITSTKGQEIEWHINEPLYCPLDQVAQVTADLDELAWIKLHTSELFSPDAGLRRTAYWNESAAVAIVALIQAKYGTQPQGA